MPAADPLSYIPPSEWSWKGEDDISARDLSPLHAKVLRYLGDDLSKIEMPRLEEQLGCTLGSQLMETWTDLAQAAYTLAPDSEPLELRTLRRSGCLEASSPSSPMSGDKSGAVDTRVAGETLRQWFAMSTAASEGSPPVELRTMRRAPEEKFAATQTLRGCFQPEGGPGWTAPADALELLTLKRQGNAEDEAEDVEDDKPGEDHGLPDPVEPDRILDEELVLLEAASLGETVNVPGDAASAWASTELLEAEVPSEMPCEGTALEGRSLQESIRSSPANSAVTSVGPAGYQAVCPLSAEDEAVTGLRRRGGVEVVVEASRPPSGISAELSVGSGRRPRSVATPSASVVSAESDPLICLGVRHGVAKGQRAKETPRSASIGRRVGQSNRKLVRNALEMHCFKGDANREQREHVLKAFDDLEKYDRFIILFRSIHTGRHDLRALYGFHEGTWTRVLQLLPSPTSLHERMVTQCLRYDSGGKEFKEVPASQETLSVADAVFVYPQYLKSRASLA